MAKKVYLISNINGGIGNDKNFPQPWTVVDCENIDISADSNSVKIAGSDQEVVINNDVYSKVIGMHYDGSYFTDKGDCFFDDHYPAIIANGENPTNLRNWLGIKLPDLVPERVWWPDVWGHGWHNQSSTTNNQVRWYVRYGKFTILATQNFLHVLSWSMEGESKISVIPKASEYNANGSGWTELEWLGLSANGAQALGIRRDFSDINDNFQYAFAFKNITTGSVVVTVRYRATKFTWGKNRDTDSFEWKEWEIGYSKAITLSASDLNRHDIHKLCCFGWNIKNAQIFITPKNGFDGTLCYNAISSTPLYERSFNLQSSGGIAYNVAKIPATLEHPMFISNTTLWVGCGATIKTFLINRSENYPDSGIILAPWNDIKLGTDIRVMSISQYGSGIVMYANGGDNAYQLFSAGLDGEVENTVVWKDAQFISVSNNGFQDFVVAKSGQKYSLYLVSWGNKKLLYQSAAMWVNFISSKWGDEYLLNFGGASFSREDRVVLGSRDRYLYLYENIQEKYKLTKFFLGDNRGLTFTDLWNDKISFFVYDIHSRKNIRRVVKLWKDWDMNQDTEASFVIPPLFANYGEGTLEEIQFWAYLPNKESKIEIWAKADEKNFITLHVKNQKGKDFSMIRINRWVEAELIDNGLDSEGNGYLSFRLVGDIRKLKDIGSNHLSITNMQNKFLINSIDMPSYDYFIKIEEVTRENQQYGSKTLGYNHTVSVKKINNHLGTFSKVHLKFVLKTNKGAFESPKVYAPIYLTYTTKENG